MGKNAKRLFFVYNPHSGRGNIRSKLFDIVQVFSEAGYEITIYPTREAKDATRQIEHLSDQYDLVVCSGGDGTLDEVVEGMMHRQKKLPLGYIPSGTVNDFARSLKIPRDMVKAARLAMSGKDFLSDVGTFNNSHFVYIAAFGILFHAAGYEKCSWQYGLSSGGSQAPCQYSVLSPEVFLGGMQRGRRFHLWNGD